ncbi:hypothetical protein BD289DRAFT_364140 [Coniella lustricola]|uniref:HotDog domain-containing protein n=1 Tax=Coniella lustricola TaxID=2025994 RepID=A0A2T3AE31_9PEZI|nr:hypothetical protein BD289DRAFT_364140 [Coniella lustricola]
MTLFRHLRASWRPLSSSSSSLACVVSKRFINTKPATFSNIQYELINRPSAYHLDHLSPTNAKLLSVSLGDNLFDNSHSHHHQPPSFSAATQTLPQGYHLVYFPPAHPTAVLLPDGTDEAHAPGPPFTRRVWAGGSIRFHPGWQSKLALDGGPALCLETIEDVRIKGVPPSWNAGTGNMPGVGEKVFVDVRRQYTGLKQGHSRVEDVIDKQNKEVDVGGHAAQLVRETVREPAIEEWRTLCFMTPKSAEEAKRDAEDGERRVIRAPSYEPTYTLSFTPTPALLFRFSALTFNAHAIHLDRHHCRHIEGYRDLLVHGPLLLTLLLTALRNAILQQQGQSATTREPESAPSLPDSVKSLDYRNLAPVYVNEELKICVRAPAPTAAAAEGKGDKKWDVWIVGPTGGLCVKGSAIIE